MTTARLSLGTDVLSNCDLNDLSRTAVDSKSNRSCNRPHQSTTALLSELHWLPVRSRITFKIACLTYKVLTTGQPYYLRSLLHYYTPHRTLRSVNQRLLEKPRVSTEFGKRFFSHFSPKTWNSLPLELRLAPTFDTFRRHLKTYLFG